MSNATSNPKPVLTAVSSPAASVLSTVPEIIAEMKAGRMVILVDEEDRENEGIWCSQLSL